MGRVEQHRGELYRSGARRRRRAYGGGKATEAGAQSIQGARRSRTARAVGGSARVRRGTRGNVEGSRRPRGARRGGGARVWRERGVRGATLGVRRGRAGYRKRRERHSFEYGLRRVRASRGRRVRRRAGDRVTRYLGIEIQSLCRYVLAAYRRGSAYSTEAGLKYFVRGSRSSARRLLGGARVYGGRGTRHRRERERRRRRDAGTTPRSVQRGYGRVRWGVRFKRGAAPRHWWVPDVYEGAPRGSSTYFAVRPKRARRAVWRRRVDLGGGSRSRAGRTRGCGRGSRRIGSRRGLHQRRIKRFLAYSSIAHVGYLRCGSRVRSREGVSAVRLYVRVYRRMSRAVWTRRRGRERGGDEGSREVKYRTDRSGRGEIHPPRARARVRALFSMAGIPPRAGFRAKLRVFRALVEGGETRVARRAVRRSVVACFNYLRRIKVIEFDRRGAEGREGVRDRSGARVRSGSVRSRGRRRRAPGPRRRRAHRRARARVG